MWRTAPLGAPGVSAPALAGEVRPALEASDAVPLPAVTDTRDESPLGQAARGDVPHYADYPMSGVPHVVARGWGARGDGAVRGHVGVWVVVDPALGDAQLERLARDIRAYHDGAAALSVRILDSSGPAMRDPEDDGPQPLSKHRVGAVSRDRKLGWDQIEVRGRVIEIETQIAPQ